MNESSQRRLDFHFQVYRKHQTTIFVVPNGNGSAAQPDQSVFINAFQTGYLMRHGGKLSDTGEGFQVWRQTIFTHAGSMFVFHQLLVPANDEVSRSWQRGEQNVGNFTVNEKKIIKMTSFIFIVLTF